MMRDDLSMCRKKIPTFEIFCIYNYIYDKHNRLSSTCITLLLLLLLLLLLIILLSLLLLLFLLLLLLLLSKNSYILSLHIKDHQKIPGLGSQHVHTIKYIHILCERDNA